jgi:hypothetical protein
MKVNCQLDEDDQLLKMVKKTLKKQVSASADASSSFFYWDQ